MGEVRELRELVYDPEDLVWLSQPLFLQMLASPEQGLLVLLRWNELLNRHPRLNSQDELIEVEELDFASGLLRLMSAYDADLRDDLLISNGTPPFLALGALLAWLMPQPSDVLCLERSVQGAGASVWLVGLALGRIRGESDGDLSEHRDLLDKLAERLRPMKRRDFSLWRVENMPKEAMGEFQSDMRAVYSQDGADAAHAFLEARMSSEHEDELAAYLRYRFRR